MPGVFWTFSRACADTVWPPVAIFGCAAICLLLFVLDAAGAYGDWCHVAKYGTILNQDASVCA